MNTLELLQIYMHIETKTSQRSQSVCFDLFLEDSEGRICTKISSCFPCCKTKPVIWQTGKKQKSYYLRSFEKTLYSKKWTHFFLWDFFTLWIRNWCKKRDSVCPFFLSSFVLILKPFSVSTWLFSIFLCTYIKTIFDINMVIFYLPL